ncbi:MAG: fimbrillin family protein [Bacteroidales bacterium]|nr:fimbrillin family protein [Bacteroidales bacterium]
MLERSIIRIAAAVTGALLLAGCTARLDPAPSGAPISFDAGSSLLRDDGTRATLPGGTHFGVFAYQQNGSVNSPGTWNYSRKPGFMFNTDVLFNGATYTYSPLRYWPAPENTLTFWAYCPYTSSPDLVVTNNTTAFTKNSSGLPDIRYTTDGHTDFMLTGLVKNQTRTTNSGVVELEFNHAMSKLNVTAKKKDPENHYTVKLKAVSFNGIFMSGTARWNRSPEGWTWASWSGARANLPLWSEDPDDPADDIELTATAAAVPGFVIPLPQLLDNQAARLHVEFSVSYAGILHERNTTREVFLSDIFTSGWEKGSHYTLELEISPDDPIEFTVSWDDWGADHNYFITS